MRAVLASRSVRARAAHFPLSRTFATQSNGGSVDSARNGGEQTHFGFASVAASSKASLVGDVFHRVAARYDAMNDIMSAGVHRLWKDAFVASVGPLNSYSAESSSNGDIPELRILDVAGGTGDIAIRLADSLDASAVRGGARSQIVICDINESMLAVGRERHAARAAAAEAAASLAATPAAAASALPRARLAWVQGDAEALPFPDASMDLYTIAFGIRNVTRVDAALREAARVLKPGGRFLCLEFSRVRNPALRAAYDAYSFSVIPAMGGAVAGDAAAYQYLVESIRRFPDQETFADMIRAAGLRGVTVTDLTGGVAAIHSAFKL